jgi:hypothetical protein
MPTSQARLRTSRAGRYAAQLCQHSGQMNSLARRHARPRGHGHGDGGTSPMPQHAEWSGADGVIDFGQGRCTLHATAAELVLTAEADDQQRLRQIEVAITGRLERIGRRDGLAVTWAPS